MVATLDFKYREFDDPGFRREQGHAGPPLLGRVLRELRDLQFTLWGVALSAGSMMLWGPSVMLALPVPLGFMADLLNSYLMLEQQQRHDLIQQAKQAPREDNPMGYTDWYHPYEASAEEQEEMQRFKEQIHKILNNWND